MTAISLNNEQVREVLPHRPPMLLIDEVSYLVPGEEIKASFYVNPEMEIFKGHFPGDPVLPGVYSVESSAQAADILIMTLERYKGLTPLFLGINNVKFKKKVLPGDTLDLHVVLMNERKDKAIVTCKATVYTDGDVAVETEVALAMR